MTKMFVNGQQNEQPLLTSNLWTHKRGTTIYYIWNASPSLWQAQVCIRIKLMESLIIGSLITIQIIINKQ